MIVVAACDGEPLWTRCRVAAVEHAEEVVREGRRRGAERFLVACDAAEAALARYTAVERVPDVLGCDAPPGVVALAAADLVERPGARLVGLAGAVASPGVRFVARTATVEDVVGEALTPAWVAVESLLRPVVLERDAVFTGGTLIVLPGEHPIARAARGDRSHVPADRPRGVPAAWLGPQVTDPTAPLSIALVSRRLGFDPA